MSVKATTKVWERSPHGGEKLLLMLALADRCRGDGLECWPAVVTLAKAIRKSERQTRRLLHALTADGLLEIETGAATVNTSTGPKRTNLYRLTLPAEPRTELRQGLGDRDTPVRSRATPDKTRHDPCHSSVSQSRIKEPELSQNTPRTRETAKPTATAGTRADAGGDAGINFDASFFRELSQRKAASYEDMPQAPATVPDTGDVAKMRDKILARPEDRRRAFYYAVGSDCPNKNRITDEAFHAVPWPEFAAAAAYTASWRLANPARHNQAAGVFVNRLKTAINRNRPPAVVADG